MSDEKHTVKILATLPYIVEVSVSEKAQGSLAEATHIPRAFNNVLSKHLEELKTECRILSITPQVYELRVCDPNEIHSQDGLPCPECGYEDDEVHYTLGDDFGEEEFQCENCGAFFSARWSKVTEFVSTKNTVEEGE